MPSPAPTVSTPSATPVAPSAPSTESSQVTPAGSDVAANDTGTQAEGTPAQPSWRDALLTADRDEVLKELIESTDSDRLIKQPKLAGLLGDLAEKRARAKETEIEKRILERQEQHRLRTLRDEDPYAYAQEQKRQEDEATSAKALGEQQQRTLAVWASDINSEIASLAQTLPEDIVKRLSTKKYEGTLAQGLRAYVTDIIDGSKEAWTAEAQEKFKRDMLPALRKEALAKLNGNAEESPTDSGGGSAPAGALTQDEWQRNGSSRAWRQSNKDRVNEALSRGAIRPLT
jgi:hypothetical protein